MTLAQQGIDFGAFTPIRGGGDQQEAINLLEQMIGRRLDIVNNFRKWGAPSGDFSAARISLKQSSSQGRVPMITWEPLLADSTQGPYTLESIANGDHDLYLQTWADGLAELGTPFYIRLMHEMNGNWYPWSGNPEAYIAAWRHVVDLFNDVENVHWVWCVNASDQPKGNDLKAYWPGWQYVDVLGVDGYNCYGGWRTPTQILKPAYDRLCALDDVLPVWICETGTSEALPTISGVTASSSKPAWIADLFATDLPRVTALLWLDSNNPASYDWRIDTSPTARQEMTRQLRAASGWVAAPGPYVPPVPDRITVVPEGAGAVRVSWRVVPSFHRGYYVYRDGYKTATVLKPSTSVRLTGLQAGPHSFSVSSYTLVRTSAKSVPVSCEVT